MVEEIEWLGMDAPGTPQTGRYSREYTLVMGAGGFGMHVSDDGCLTGYTGSGLPAERQEVVVGWRVRVGPPVAQILEHW
jgi:hypothetical protein